MISYNSCVVHSVHWEFGDRTRYGLGNGDVWIKPILQSLNTEFLIITMLYDSSELFANQYRTYSDDPNLEWEGGEGASMGVGFPAS